MGVRNAFKLLTNDLFVNMISFSGKRNEYGMKYNKMLITS